jgi:hypothetical protein
MNKLPLSQRVSFDDHNEILIINGIGISGELLETISTSTPISRWFRIIKCENGVSHVCSIDFNYLQSELLSALQQIATGKITGDEKNNKATVAIMRKIAAEAVEKHLKDVQL